MCRCTRTCVCVRARARARVHMCPLPRTCWQAEAALATSEQENHRLKEEVDHLRALVGDKQRYWEL